MFSFVEKCFNYLSKVKDDSGNFPIISSGNFPNIDDSKNWTVLSMKETLCTSWWFANTSTVTIILRMPLVFFPSSFHPLTCVFQIITFLLSWKKFKFNLYILSILCRKIGVIFLIFSNLLHFKTTHIMIFFSVHLEGYMFWKCAISEQLQDPAPSYLFIFGIFNHVTFALKYIWPTVSGSLHNESVSHNKWMIKLLPLKRWKYTS